MTSYADFERAGWERAAARYRDSFQRATAAFVDPRLDAIGPCDGPLLDLACGPGLLSMCATARGARIIAVDFAQGMVEEAHRAQPDLPVVRADAQRLPFAASSFAAVAINFGVHHFPDPARAIGECARVLRSGGRLAFTIWEAPTLNPVQKLVFDAIAAVGGARPQLPPPPGGLVVDAEACERLCRTAGFVAVQVSERAMPVRLHSADALLQMLLEGTVQTAAVIRSQSDAHLPAIRAHIAEAMEPYRDGDAYAIPARALVTFALR